MAYQHMPKALDITSIKFGRLTAIKCIGTKWGKKLWLFQCDCGEAKEATQNEVSSGKTSSCGCLRAESARRCGKLSKGAIKHNLHSIPEYSVWKTMRQRCLNCTNADYPQWGGRGITVCPEWDSFETFIQDMGRRPSPKHSIDRINNDGNYDPTNCRWATIIEQNNNRRERKAKNGY